MHKLIDGEIMVAEYNHSYSLWGMNFCKLFLKNYNNLDLKAILRCSAKLLYQNIDVHHI